MNLKVFSLIILASVASAIAQNNQGGTLVTAPIRPFAVQDTFPTAWANEIKGGPFTSTNLAGLSNIPTSRLEIGSLGYAQDTGLLHRLTSTSPVTWSPIDGSNFTNLPSTTFSGTLAISNGGTGATNAGGARTNLGLGATWLTNTNVTNFRTAIGLGTANSPTFESLVIGTSGDIVVNGGGISGYDALISLEEGFFYLGDGGSDWNLNGSGFMNVGGIGFLNSNAVTTTRNNLGLGATWLTNSTAPLFWTSVPASPTNSGTAGQIAYTNNFLYICISNNTWRRVQLGTW